MEIAENIILFSKSDEVVKPKNLVVLFSWVGAHDKPVSKYVNYYLSKNSEVLVAKLSFLDGLWPILGSQVSNNKLPTHLCKSINCKSLKKNNKL